MNTKYQNLGLDVYYIQDLDVETINVLISKGGRFDVRTKKGTIHELRGDSGDEDSTGFEGGDTTL